MTVGERIGFGTAIYWDYGKRRKFAMDHYAFAYRAYAEDRTEALRAEHEEHPEKFLRGYSPRTVEIHEVD